MNNGPIEYHRRSIRLKEYDYASAGAYFITLCAHNRACIFGNIVDSAVILNSIGMIAQEEWVRTAAIRPEIELEEFMVMPNHLHGIIVIDHADTLQRVPTVESFGKPTSNSIPTIVRGFKAAVTFRINTIRRVIGLPVWQRGYYEHVIRNERELNAVREYIQTNPANWEKDEEFVP